MVQQVCVLKDLYVLHKLSVVTVQRLTVSETEGTVGELLKSSSEYVLQMVQTAQSGLESGLSFKKQIKCGCAAKDNLIHVTFSNIFGEGEGLHQAAFKYRNYLQR